MAESPSFRFFETAVHPSLGLNDVISVLRIYRDSAESALHQQPENEVAKYMYLMTENSLFYLDLFKGSIQSLDKLNSAVLNLQLKAAQVTSPPQ